jgi:hypothetical protein
MEVISPLLAEIDYRKAKKNMFAMKLSEIMKGERVPGLHT